jgi:phosphoglycolate/pyridoxal phosphate phosphatase family enzyme
MFKSIKDIAFSQKFNALFSTVLFDCSGVIWRGGKLLPGTKEIFSHLRQNGKRFYLVNNHSGHSRKTLVNHCSVLGLEGIKEEHIACSAHLTSSYLKNTLNLSDKVFLIGNRGMVSELDALGIKHTGIGRDITVRHGSRADWMTDWVSEYSTSVPPIGCVLVGFDEHVTYASMLRATACLRADPKCHFIATNDDPTNPVNATLKGVQLEIPGTGAIVRAIAVAAGREPIVMGKPHAPMFEHIKEMYAKDTGNTLDPSKTLFIGDRLVADVSFARKFGMHSLLLTDTGVSGQLEEARTAHEAVERAAPEGRDALLSTVPDYYCKSLVELVATLKQL